MLKSFEEYSSFRGRATRWELWSFHILLLILNMLVGLGAFFFMRFGIISGLLLMIPDVLGIYVLGAVIIFYVLATLIALIATTVRRLHDLNLSSWWLLGYYLVTIVVGVVSVLFDKSAVNLPHLQSMADLSRFSKTLAGMISMGAGLIYFVTLFIIPGTRGPNKYGPDERKMRKYVRTRSAELRAARKAEKKVKNAK